MLYYDMIWYTILYYAILYYAILYYTIILYHAILYYATCYTKASGQPVTRMRPRSAALAHAAGHAATEALCISFEYSSTICIFEYDSKMSHMFEYIFEYIVF